MSDLPNTLFLRLEGPLQAWGDPSKFVIRRTMDAPTKSGVIGLICCAMGRSRQWAVQHPIPDDGLNELAQRLIVRDEQVIVRNKRDDPEPRRALLDLLSTLRMGVRKDRPGVRWWDYHTVGAGIGILQAAGGIKINAKTKQPETLITRREYLADASFLVALQGDTSLIQEVNDALAKPKWPLYLGRKSCSPTVPVLVTRRRDDGSREADTGRFGTLLSALASQPWRPRCESDTPRDGKGNRREAVEEDCLIEWQATSPDDPAPPHAEVWYDVPEFFDPPYHKARFVVRESVRVEIGDPTQRHTPSPVRARTDYGKTTWGPIRDKRLDQDHHLCVFCKTPLTKYNATVQHVTYRHAGKEDYLAALADTELEKKRLDELRSLCRLCHDAVTMIEYGLGMGLDRINPEEERWRDRIIEKRRQIIEFRSLETRRRKLAAEEVE